MPNNECDFHSSKNIKSKEINCMRKFIIIEFQTTKQKEKEINYSIQLLKEISV